MFLSLKALVSEVKVLQSYTQSKICT